MQGVPAGLILGTINIIMLGMNQRIAYSYVRMSTDKQIKGDSLRRQLEASATYAKNNNLKLIDSIDGVALSDIGVSAFKGANTQKGALATFLKALEDNLIEPNSVLLVESLDRLSRDKVTEALPQFLSIVNKGIEIVTLLDNQKYTKEIINSNPTAMYIGLGSMVRANEESAIKAKRIKAAWTNKRANTDKKVLTRICPAWLKYSDDKESFEVIPERGEVVKKIFEMSAQACGYYTITRYLNEAKVPVFGKSKHWHSSYIKKILVNRATFGEFQPYSNSDGVREKVGDPIKGYFPSVISEEIFLLVQDSVSRRSKQSQGRKGDNFTNLFSGLMHCGHCGSSMMVRNRGNQSKNIKYMLCRNQLDNGGCKMTPWNLSDLESVVFKHLRDVDFSLLLNRSEKSEQVELEDRSTVLKLKLDAKKSEIKRTADAMVAQDLSQAMRNVFVQKFKELENESSILNKELSDLEKLIREKHESQQILNSSALKNLIDQIELHQNDYLFRSTLNQFLIKLIDEIILNDHRDQFSPWELEESDKVIDSFRASYKVRSNLTFEEVINHREFEFFYKVFNRTIDIKYKSGVKRHLLFGIDTSLTV
jgi:DNA invertase Pin-like site-specific DNA recombinase